MFLLSQNDENQSENGSKNSKIRLRARPPAEPQKKMLQTKKLRSKSWKTRGFFHFTHTHKINTIISHATTALDEIDFAWQVWHTLTSTVPLRGRRGTNGTGCSTHGARWRAWSDLVACPAAALCVAGPAQTNIHSYLRVRRGTTSYLQFFVAGSEKT